MKHQSQALIRMMFTLVALIGLHPITADAVNQKWQARIIDVAEQADMRLVDDYARIVESGVWDFKEGNLGAVRGWKGMTAPEIDNGWLHFKTHKGGELTFGDFYGTDPEQGELKIGMQWWQHAWPWIVRIHLRQNVQQSTWGLDAAYRRHGKVKTKSSTVEVTGTGKQMIEFEMPTAGRELVHALRLSTDAVNADMAIDWIEIVRPSMPKVFWTDFSVDGTPENARLVFSASGMAKIYVNGRLMGNVGGRHPLSRRLNRLDVSGVVRKGLNRVCVEMEGFTSHSRAARAGNQFFFLEGGVVTENGDVMKIATDGDWLAGQGENGCSNPEDIAFRNAKDLGKVAAEWFAAEGLDNNMYMANAPYIGPIIVKHEPSMHPFYTTGKDVRVGIRVIGRNKRYARARIHYSLSAWSAYKTDAQAIQLEEDVANDQDALNLGRLDPGVYALKIRLLEDGKELDHRLEEIVVIGSGNNSDLNAGAYTGQVSKKLVDSFKPGEKTDKKVLCGKHKQSSAFQARSKSGHVVNSLTQNVPGLSLPRGRLGWCSFELKTGELYKPHMLEIKYPLGQTANMIFVLSEESGYPNIHNLRRGEGVVRLSSGIYVSAAEDGHGSSRYIYWPNSEEASVTILNADTGLLSTGAINEANLYELGEELPTSRGTNNDLLIGPFVERIDRTTPRLFYAGPHGVKFSQDQVDGYYPGYYADWYKTIENLISYLKYSGQNTYYAGIYMYHGGWFPSQKFQGDATSGVNNLPLGWEGGAIELMARMFEENDLNLVLGVQFIGSRRLQELDNVTDLEVISGKRTVRFVNADGRQARTFQDGGFNFLTPEVENEVLELADEIGRKFLQFPAIKGITWMRTGKFPSQSGGGGATDSPLNTGYGDYTIQRYVTETGSVIPPFEGGRERFMQRRQWLLQNEREKWISWRTQKVYELDKKIHAKLMGYRSDIAYWHVFSLRQSPELIKAWGTSDKNIQEIIRTMGVDEGLYRAHENKPRLMILKDIGVDRMYLRSNRHRDLAGYAKDLYSDPGFFSLIRNHDVLVNVGFMVEANLVTDKQWGWKSLRIVGNSLPAESLLLEGIEKTSSQGIKAIAIGWSDVGHFCGYEQETRRFAGEQH